MNHEYALTKMASKGGCMAKQSPRVLKELLSGFPVMENQNLLVGYNSSDDAAVYQLNEHQAVVQTIDFFPPPVDDPWVFGQIAAANALSDVYAMGGTPVLALNLLTFPSCLDQRCVRLILEGGYEKIREAGAVVAGGHTIEDREPKYGLAVTGMVDPEKCWKNSAAQPGDVLILTKPIGVGIYALASRGELLEDEDEQEMLKWMTMLNRKAKEVLEQFTVHACTDITGFGLLGHAYEMAEGSRETVCLWAKRVPLLERARELAAMGIVPEGAYRNREYLEGKAEISESVTECEMDCFLDPQTSGGLLAAVPEKEAEDCLEAMKKEGCFAGIIGEVVPREGSFIKIR